MVVNEALSNALWPDQDPLGARTNRPQFNTGQ
jgi:hypothetical protein